MFVLSLTDGRLYRITQRPPELQMLTDMSFVPVPEPAAAAGVMLALPALAARRSRCGPRRGGGRPSRA